MKLDDTLFSIPLAYNERERNSSCFDFDRPTSYSHPLLKIGNPLSEASTIDGDRGETKAMRASRKLEVKVEDWCAE